MKTTSAQQVISICLIASCSLAWAETGITNTIAGTYILGTNGAFNALIVTNAGVLIDTGGIIGNSSAASNNTAIITGSGSRWNNSGDLYVGRQSSGNRLIITAGGVVTNAEALTWRLRGFGRPEQQCRARRWRRIGLDY